MIRGGKAENPRVSKRPAKSSGGSTRPITQHSLGMLRSDSQQDARSRRPGRFGRRGAHPEATLSAQLERGIALRYHFTGGAETPPTAAFTSRS